MNALTDEQLAAFTRDGYLVVPGVVDEELLAAADHEIDELVAQQPPAEGHRNPAYFLEPERLPACDAALRESSALLIANQLVAPHKLDHALDHIQVVLSFPGWSHIPGGPHIDGHRPEQDEPHSFTTLAGIYLTDEAESVNGNLWVWPGSHRWHARMFQNEGVGALLPSSGHSLPPSAPEPVLAKRGDLLLAHFLLGHNAGGNESDHTRRIIYFRLSCEGHRERWRQTFLDPLTEYAPLRHFDLGEEAEVV